MLKFKTFNLIMLLLQVMGAGVSAMWGYRSISKSNVFFHLSVVSFVHMAFILMGSIEQIAVGGSILVLVSVTKWAFGF